MYNEGELRRERAQEYEATVIFPVLGRNVRFLSMVATPLKLADLLKVVAHCPRPERLARRALKLRIIRASVLSRQNTSRSDTSEDLFEPSFLCLADHSLGVLR
jgi:hypothetical protein